MRTLALTILAVAAITLPAFAEDMRDYYDIESIKMPENVVGEIGGISALPNGKLAVVFYREGVFFYDPTTKQWTHFAYGLHEPLGIHAVSEREVVVMQRPELTRVIDTDGDGKADHFQTLCDDWGMSGNYHEFAFGPAVGPDGKYYVSLNCASSGDGIFKEVRGEFRKDGRPGRMYACVPYRGWVLRVDPRTGDMEPYALGFRSPNGIGFDTEGNLYVTDNQGDWIGTSPVYHVEQDKFYGHAASLVWRDGWDGGVPKNTPVADLDKMRTRPAIQFPHGVLANSPTQPIADTSGGKFGPFAGQVLIGEMNHPHIIRCMFENVAGKRQGAATTLIAKGLPKGIGRFAFDKNGTLWVGHDKRDKGWGGGTGLSRITWNGKTPMDVHTMKLTDTGFAFAFTKPVDPATVNADAFTMSRYYYEYHEKYGSDRYDNTPVKITDVTISENKRTVRVTVDALKAGYVYDVKLGDIKASDGAGVVTPKLYYTANRLLDGTEAPPQIPAARVVKKLDPKKLKASKAVKVDVPVPAGATVYEAESAGVFGPKIDRKNDGFTGKGFADFNAKSNESVAWKVNVEEAGAYTLAFRYALEGGNRPLRVSVNGKTVAKKQPFNATGSWTTWKTTEIKAKLKKGDNVIEIRSIGHSGPNVDHLQVVPR